MPDAISSTEIHALARLLDDPDPAVQRSVQARLETLGRDALPHLMDARDTAARPLRAHIDEAIHRLHVDGVLRAWTHVMDRPDVNLERGAFLLALYRFPTLDIPTYRQRLDHWAAAARPDVEQARGVEKAFALADFFTQTLGLRGNAEHYYDPNNSYLNQVMDRKRGIPISLSVLYLLLAERLQLPVYGINMPTHFLVKYADGQTTVFLDLFNEGEYVSKEACIRFLLKAGIKPRPHYFAPAPPQHTLLRMARNLLAIAEKTGQDDMASDLKRMLTPWDPSFSD